MSFTINLKPIYYTACSDSDWLPGKQPYFHQKKIYDLVLEARQRKEFLCIFNRAVTGGGKTLASFAASIRHNIPAFGLYPTNELIEDQERALQQQLLNPTPDQLRRIDSRELDKWQVLSESKSHQETLRPLLNWGGIVLTNPDIFYFLYFGLYKGISDRFAGIAELLFSRLAFYPVIVFDEFHLYNIKQIGNVAFIIATLQQLQKEREKVFIFSSATPNPRFLEVLTRLNIRTEHIETQKAEADDHRAVCVSQPLSLMLIPGDLASWKGLEALTQHISFLEGIMKKTPETKAVFIFDSVADSLKLTALLRAQFPECSVGEVHGLASKQERKQALASQFTVGTSTIEVGIDFKGEYEKDLLVFEARTGSQFIQRLGRIARHAKSSTLPNQAIAIVPSYVYNEVTSKLTPGMELDREKLYEHIENAYQSPNEFEGYFTRYAPVEALAGVKFLLQQQMPDTQSIRKAELEQTVELIYGKPIKKVYACYSRLCREKMIKPLLFFRGSGFNIALIDIHVEGFPLKIYDLFLILRRFNFKELSSDEFEDRLKTLQEEWEKEIDIFRKRTQLVTSDVQDLLGIYGYFELQGFLEKARKIWFEVDRDDIVMNNFTTEDVAKITGLSIGSDDPSIERRLRRLNRLLRRKEFACWVSPRSPASLQFRKSLPTLFQLYELKPIGRSGKEGNSWTIAFNQNAYFMNCLWFKEQPKQVSNCYIV